MARSVRKNWSRFYRDAVRWHEERMRHLEATGRSYRWGMNPPEVQDYHEKGKGWRPYWREDDDYYRRPAKGTVLDNGDDDGPVRA